MRLIDNTSHMTQEKAHTKPLAIRKIITIASAKGGVGKSTLAVNLAVAMAKVGLNVGLLDVDIYGPSCHILLGQADATPEATPAGTLKPIEAHGVKSFSIAYVSDLNRPMLWRGPIVSRAIQKMFLETEWAIPDAPLDVLIIDTPPGTGEAHLTLAQSLPVDAAVLVTTPSQLAIADVVRGAGMYDSLEIPILGIVEMMSYLNTDNGPLFPFGQGDVTALSERLGVPVLAQIPIDSAINAANTNGTPYALDLDVDDLFIGIGAKIAKALDKQSQKRLPEIIFED